MQEVRDHEVVNLIADIAREPLAENRASLSASRVPVGGNNHLDSVQLDPTNLHACPVSLAVLSESQVNLFLGPSRRSATLEIWEDERSAAMSCLRELVTAVVDGRYEQRVKVRGRRLRIKGVFHLPGRELKHSYSGPTDEPNTSRGWTVLSYEPF